MDIETIEYCHHIFTRDKTLPFLVTLSYGHKWIVNENLSFLDEDSIITSGTVGAKPLILTTRFVRLNLYNISSIAAFRWFSIGKFDIKTVIPDVTNVDRQIIDIKFPLSWVGANTTITISPAITLDGNFMGRAI